MVEPRDIGPRLDHYRNQAARRWVRLSVALSLAGAYAAAVGWRSGELEVHAVSALFFFASGVLACRARALDRRCPLGSRLRLGLLVKLRGLEPLNVRVSAIAAPDSIRYARELRNVIGKADWPVMGVYKRRDEPAGLAMAVRNILAPPGEAIALFDAFRRAGTRIVWAHKPGLGDDRSIELQVGKL